MVKALFAFITEVSLRFKWIVVGLAAVFLVLGAIAFTQFNQELIPEIEFPATFILIQSPGKTPDELVSLLTIPIEENVSAIEDVINVQSTTGSGFAFLQISNDFGIDQDALRQEIRAGMNAAWLESGLARIWESVDVATFHTTADVTPAVIDEAWEKWPYLLSDLTLAQLFSLPPDTVAALPEVFIATLPETTQRSLLDAVSGVREVGTPIDLPQSWLGLSRTADLTPEIVAQITATAPTMFNYFRDEDGNLIESYIFAMSPAVIEALPDDLTANMSACSVEQLNAVINGTANGSTPILLPGAWRSSPPEIISFSFNDLPLASVSVSAEGVPPAQLRGLVQDRVIPRLVELEGIADASLSGGQLLPGEEGIQAANVEADPEEASSEATPEGTPLPAISPWRLIGAQFAAVTGKGIEYYEDLSPELVNLIVTFVDSMGIPLINGQTLLAQLQNDTAIAALPADTLAWMPAAYAEGLTDAQRAAADARVAAATRYQAVGEAATAAAEAGRMPVYFRLFAEMGKQFGLPLSLNGPQDLSPEIVSTFNALIPGGAGVELLRPLTAAMWEQVPVETLGWLPASFVASLGEAERAAIEARAEAVGGVGALAAAAEESGDLPPFFTLITQQPLLGGRRLCGPEDLSPELLSTLGSFLPQTLNSLPPETLRRLSPEALAALPAGVVESLPDDLRAELDERAAAAGGLGAGAAENATAGSNSPNMPDSWSGNPQLPKTAAEMVASQYGAAGFLNLIFQYDAEGAASLFADLTPEIVNYLIENQEGFLDILQPGVLSLFPQDVLATLPEAYQEIAANAFIPTDTVTRTNGEASLLLTIFKDGDANTVEAAHRLYDELDKLEGEIDGLETVVSFEQASFIEESIDGVAREGLLGAVFAIIVIFFFLHRSWRSTIVTAVSIPLSLMIAFALMLWLAPAVHTLLLPLAQSYGGIWSFFISFFPKSVTLNLLTLSGMTVAIGRVVDDSIVVLENIYRHIHSGDDPEKAVREGARDVSIAIFASTVTTVAVFLPIVLAGGLIGTFFIPFGMAVSYALGASFIVAITVIPVLARWFVRRKDMPEQTENGLERLYKPALEWALSHRAIVIVVAAVLFTGSIVLLVQRPKAFLPSFGEPQVSIQVGMPNGTGIIETNALVLELEDYLHQLQAQGRLGDYQVSVGSSGGMAAAFLGGGQINPAAAELTALAADGEDLDRLAQDIRCEAERILGADNVTVSAGSLTETGLAGLSLVLSGDLETLQAIDPDVRATLAAFDGLANISSSFDQASQAGGAAILRVDRQTAVQYSAELETDDALGIMAEAKDAVVAMLQERGLADQVTVSEGFTTEMQTQGFSSIVTSLGLAIIVVYAVMVMTFRSFVHPFTILFSVPLAVVGAALALFLTDRVLDLSAMVGMLMLVGIVVTNAIVMIDRVQSNRKERGMGAYDGLVEGARTRLRPILMTALAAIFALFPLAAQLMGPGGAIISASLGTVVIGGLLTSTFFTLLVVPVVYLSLDRLTRRR